MINELLKQEIHTIKSRAAPGKNTSAAVAERQFTES